MQGLVLAWVVQTYDLTGDTPYYSVDEYVGDLAGVCGAYPKEVKARPAYKAGPLCMAFWRNTDPKRLVHVVNNQRRHVFVAVPSPRISCGL